MSGTHESGSAVLYHSPGATLTTIDPAAGPGAVKPITYCLRCGLPVTRKAEGELWSVGGDITCPGVMRGPDGQPPPDPPPGGWQLRRDGYDGFHLLHRGIPVGHLGMGDAVALGLSLYRQLANMVPRLLADLADAAREPDPWD